MVCIFHTDTSDLSQLENLILFPVYFGLYTSADTDSKIFTIIVNLNLIVVTYNKLMCMTLFSFVFNACSCLVPPGVAEVVYAQIADVLLT